MACDFEASTSVSNLCIRGCIYVSPAPVSTAMRSMMPSCLSNISFKHRSGSSGHVQVAAQACVIDEEKQFSPLLQNKYRGFWSKLIGQWQPEMHCLAPRAAFGSPVTCPWLARLSAVARLTRRLLLLHNRNLAVILPHSSSPCLDLLLPLDLTWGGRR